MVVYSVFYFSFKKITEQERYLTSWDYMAHQPTLNWKMREILVDWIIDVHKKMRLSPHSLWLTVNLVDRTLASCVIERVRLQLVGIAALSLACKLDEVRAPYPGDLTYITDGAYTTGDLLDMELRVWKAVNYELIVPSGYNFIIHFLDTIHASDVTRSLALYYGERNLQEVTHLSAKPSVYAAACVYAAISQRLQQGEPVCSDLPSEERTRSTETLKPLRISLTDNVNKHSSDMTPTTDTVDDATVPQSSASGEAAMPIGEPSDAATEAILETVIETAAGSVTGCGPAIQQTHSTGMIEIDRCCQPVVVVPAPIRESRDRSILTEVILWGLNLTRRAPVRITAETETVTVRDGASKAPAASQSNHNSAFSPPFASPTDTITSKSNSSNIESNVTGHALIATSSAAAAKTSTSGGASSNAAVSVHAKVAGAERFEEDVTEEEVRHGAEKISQELSPEDVRNLPSLARALVAMAAIVTENRTTRICLHRQLDSAQRKYATISRMCVSNLPLPFEAAVAEAEELSVPTRQHGPILIKAGKENSILSITVD